MTGPWESDVVLSDGLTVHIRPIQPSDKDALIAFHARQGRESLYYRYFSARSGLSEKEAERFTNVDMENRAGLVVEDGDQLIAWGSFDRWPGRDDADVAFFTDDSHNGRGIATLLLEHLAALATAVGIRGSRPRCWATTGRCSRCSRRRDGRCDGPSRAASSICRGTCRRLRPSSTRSNGGSRSATAAPWPGC